MVQVKQKKSLMNLEIIIFDINNQAGYLWHELIARNNKKQFITPYLSKDSKRFLL